jgi:hypothetical protein
MNMAMARMLEIISDELNLDPDEFSREANK